MSSEMIAFLSGIGIGTILLAGGTLFLRIQAVRFMKARDAERAARGRYPVAERS